MWRDRFRGTYYDEPQLTINFQSGNIMPIRRKPLVEDPQNPRRVYVGGAQAAVGAAAVEAAVVEDVADDNAGGRRWLSRAFSPVD